ncbi:hypothetical protein [Synechococcus phage S-EIVl]|nr:hypothetical protein [Synechococcus phage S-EIVl]
MTLFLLLFLGWAGASAIALIINHAIHSNNGED